MERLGTPTDRWKRKSLPAGSMAQGACSPIANGSNALCKTRMARCQIYCHGLFTVKPVI